MSKPKTFIGFYFRNRPRVIKEFVLGTWFVIKSWFRWATEIRFYLHEWRSHVFVCTYCGKTFNVWRDGGMWGGNNWAACHECCKTCNRKNQSDG